MRKASLSSVFSVIANMSVSGEDVEIAGRERSDALALTLALTARAEARCANSRIQDGELWFLKGQ